MKLHEPEIDAAERSESLQEGDDDYFNVWWIRWIQNVSDFFRDKIQRGFVLAALIGVALAFVLAMVVVIWIESL